MLRFFKPLREFGNACVVMVLLCVLLAACGKRSGKPRVLVFSKQTYFFHTSIPNGIAAIQKLGSENNFDVDTTTDAARFTEDSLKQYAAVIFLHNADNAGALLNNYQEAAFERYIQAGGGYVGIHAASDAEMDWGWYGKLVGAYFNGHPDKHQVATLNVVDQAHPSTKDLPKQWKRNDEWYNFTKLNPDVHVLISIDESTYQGGTNGANHPMAWYHDYDGGRSFFTALGHVEETFTEPLFLKHLLGGITYAMGDNKKLDYSKARTQQVPDEDRFVKTVLNQGNFFEPTEMAILPNLDVLIAQRRGELLLYSDKTRDVKQVGFLNVYHQTNTPGVNAEEGVLGLTTDPNYASNHFIYVFYSPIDTSVNRLSRFEFRGDTIDMKTEKVVLQFYSQREICCHTGGSIAFGNDRMLYLATGDNSTPFDEPKNPFANHGFAPLDDRPGKIQYDARRSSGNSNDLRGKTIRIRIKEDGTYEIPKGNLFEDGKEGRPEIYTMGHRNPYRLSVDKHTNFLYWGEVGPDSGVDSLGTRGPRGYDEVNQARKAGFYGWPLIIGNNYAYNQHDYTTGKNGDAFDPMKPVNASRNNTGLQNLPPAIPAFIWYPYAVSKEFPQLGTGGRNAMAGPVYYVEDYPKATRYPDYFNGKFFMYEWMRNFIKLVRMFPNGDYDKMDAFMPQAQLSNPIDMEVGPDGRIYILEYGKGWFSKNPDAGISRIDYIAGNRPPKVDSLVVERESGSLPYTLNAAVKAKDPEGDKLKYIWTIGGEKKETTEPRLQYTIAKGGEYAVSVEVVDDEKAASKSSEVTVYAGNEQPQVAIELSGNKSFYFAGRPVQYKVNITDKGETLDSANVFVKSDFVESNEDLANQGHQIVPDEILGKNLMLSSDCKGCHKVDEKSIGPSYVAVAQRYQKDGKASTYLINKIIKGGAGAWGDVAMPAHPTMKEGDVKLITTYILSLVGDGLKKKSLPLAGQVAPADMQTAKQNMLFTLTASYTDVGGNGVRPLSGSNIVYLRNPTVDVGHLRDVTGFTSKDSSGSKYLILPAAQGAIKGGGLDLSGIRRLEFTGFGSGEAGRYQIEVHTGSATGPLIGNGEMSFGADSQKVIAVVPVQPQDNGAMQDVYVVFKAAQSGSNNRPLLKWIRFVPGTESPIAMRR